MLYMTDLSWEPDDIHFIITIIWISTGFGLYYFLSIHSSLAARIWKVQPGLDLRVKQVLLQRIWGLIFLGLIPVGIVLLVFNKPLLGFGLNFRFSVPPPWWTYLLLPLILLVGYFNSPREGNLARYPQIRVKIWTMRLLMLNGISWIIFLVAYEFFFRGFLLYASLSIMSPWQAIMLNSVLYATAHFYKGPAEAFGSIPAGILFCYLTILTGNIGTVIFLHAFMAISLEWLSLRAHPEMKYESSKQREL